MANAKIDTKDAVKEINNLIEQFNLLIKATGDVSTISKANFRKVETALQGLQKVSAQSNATFNQLNDAQKKASLAANAEAEALRKSSKELDRNAKAAKSAAVSQEVLEKNTIKTTGALSGFFTGLWSVIKAFGVFEGLRLGAAIIKDAYSLTKQFDSMKFSLETVTESLFDAAISNRFMLEITNDFGVELVATTQRWIKFLAAAKQSGVTLKDTEDIFRSVTKAGATLGLQTDDLATVYLALEQMMSKGKVTTEELRRQLGEKLPGAVGIMAAAVGVNVNELDKLLKKGELLSADVLPKFAKALEAAYGIETLESIETIVSAQNRLTNAWEIFVKNVVEGKSWIGITMNSIAGGISNVLTLLGGSSSYYKNMFNNKAITEGKIFAKHLTDIATGILDEKKAQDKQWDYLDNEARLAREHKLTLSTKNTSKIERDAAQKRVDETTADLVAYGLERDKILKSIAKQDIDRTAAAYDAQVIITEEARKAMEENSTRATNRVYGIQLQALAKLESRLAHYRKLVEESTAVGFKDDDAPGRKPATFEVKPVNDLTNELRKVELKNQKELNDELLAGDKASYEERQKAAMDNVGIGLEIAQVAYDEEIEKADSYYFKMLDDLNDAIRKGSKIEGDQLKFRMDLKQNHIDATLIATQNQNKAVLDVEQKFAEEQIKLAKQVEDEKIAISDSKYNKDVIAAKNAYNASAKTAADQKTLDEALTKAAIEQGNAQIEIRIATLEALLEYGDLTDTQTKDTILLIEKLKASLQTFKPGDDLKTAADKFVEILEFVSEASQAISDLGSAIFDRKIESINAEIEAEKNKYDTLIGLAKGNKDEQVRLQTEKDAKLKELEAKRLKEEQRKAKFEKANALIQIAINTAIAIAKAAGQTGTGFVITTPMLIALGAIQAATVLAQPIPKYEHGLKNAKSDHIGMINDGPNQEFIERDGNILTTSTKNAIVNLKKGDTVHKSYDDMVGDSIFSNLSRSILLNGLSTKPDSYSREANLEKVFDKNLKTLNKDLKNGIKDGFKNVNIHNHTSYDADWIRYKNDTL